MSCVQLRRRTNSSVPSGFSVVTELALCDFRTFEPFKKALGGNKFSTESLERSDLESKQLARWRFVKARDKRKPNCFSLDGVRYGLVQRVQPIDVHPSIHPSTMMLRKVEEQRIRGYAANRHFFFLGEFRHW